MDKIALFGAAGSLGKSIANALSAAGAEYRVVGRSDSALRTAFGADPRAEIITWDPDRPASVRSAAEGVDTIIYLVGVPYWQFELHPQLMRKTIDGAIAAGVSKLLLIGTVYPFGRPRTERVSEDHPREPHTFKGRMRKQQEDIVLEAHASGKIATCILRLPDFYGPGVDKSFLWAAFEAAKNNRRAQLVGPVDTPHEFVYVPDVGPVIERLTKEPSAWGPSWNLGGVGVASMREMAAMAFEQTGHKPRYMVAGKTTLRIMGVFSPLMREMVEMNYLLTEPVILDDTRIHTLLGHIHKTSYADGIQQTLASMPSA